jgi:hypothetical protein
MMSDKHIPAPSMIELQVWTTPLWLVLMIGPVAYLIYQEPTLVSQFATFTGNEGFATSGMTITVEMR